ncbi:MAG: hypothetical protein KUL81_06520 [Azonexus sp.]|nr:hypothetical protein [Azonexus sp.]
MDGKLLLVTNTQDLSLQGVVCKSKSLVWLGAMGEQRNDSMPENKKANSEELA